MSLKLQIEEQFIDKLKSLKYEYRQDIRDRDGLEKNFREKFQALNRVQFGDADFERHLGEIITPDVFAAAKILRGHNSFARDDGTPLNYTLVNISTLRTGAKTCLKSSISFASTPTTGKSLFCSTRTEKTFRMPRAPRESCGQVLTGSSRLV